MKLNYFIGAHENVTQNGHDGPFSIHFRSLLVSVGSFDCRFGGCDKYLMQHAGTFFFAFNSFESLVGGQQSPFFGGGNARDSHHICKHNIQHIFKGSQL